MKDIKAAKASNLLHRLISEGEHETQDFKFTVNDPRKIARSLSAFANNKGGRLLIGVDDNGKIKGVRNEEDIYVVEAAASVYCKPSCNLEFTAYKEKGGAMVVCAEVCAARKRPVFVKEEGASLRAYYRVDDENIAVPQIIVRAWQAQSDPERQVVFGINPDKTSLLKALEETPLTINALERRVSMSSKRLEECIVELFSIGVIEFVYINREFNLKVVT